MFKKLLLAFIVVVLIMGSLGCSRIEETFSSKKLQPSDETITDEEAERLIKMVQDFPYQDGTIKSFWDEISGPRATQQWQAYRPIGYDHPDIYFVELTFETKFQDHNYQLVVQWLINLDKKSMRDIYYEVNGEISDKLSVEAIMNSIK